MGKFFSHLRLITKHRHQVIRNASHMGIFFHSLKHDLSKYTSAEFVPSYKNYKGNESPVYSNRLDNDGYSTIAIHHTRRNPHHFEYWVDIFRGYALVKPMPFKYALEYVADMLAASKTYDKKNFSGKVVYNYFISRKKYYIMHSATMEFVETCFLLYDKSGFKELKKKNTKKLYEEIIKKYDKVEAYKLEKMEESAKDILYGKK